jgi:polygalacturonase
MAAVPRGGAGARASAVVVLTAIAAAAGLPASATDRSRSSCSIVAHGARTGNRTDDAVGNARAIQQALASCGKVTVPPGAFKLTPIVLPSHTELYLEHGASLVGSERWHDYGTSHMLPPLGNSGTQPGLLMLNPLISASGATNVTITGANGTIDGNGWVGWPSANWSNPECGLRRHCASTPWTGSDAPGTVRPPQLVAFTRSSWVTIINITFTNPPYWGLQHYFCNDTFMAHVTILAPRWTRQIAGFMPFSVRRYTVEDSYVAVGDDAVAIMSGPDFVDGACQADASVPCPVAPYSQPSQGMVFRRVFVLGRSFAVGSEDFGNVTDVLIDDCTIGDDEGSSSHAFYFKMHSNCGNATKTQCRIGDIVVRNTKFGWIRNNTWQNPGNEGNFAIQIGMKYSDPPIDPSLPQPVISNISFINVTATKVFQVLSSAGGSLKKVSGLHFVDCNFHATSPDPWVLHGVDVASCTSVNSFPPFPVLPGVVQTADEAAATVAAFPFDPVRDIHKVHVLFSHHLDVGLDIGLKLTEDCVGFATKIVQRYFDDFIPRAIKLANELRAKRSKDRFAYTMHPWVLSLYVDCDPWTIEDDCPLNKGTLRCPSKTELAAFDSAVRRGDILWAASPMNLDPGAVGSPELFKELLSISAGLNERYNITKRARVWSNVDVPGFVRSSVPLLVQSGVKFLSIGANARNGFPNGSYPINQNSAPWQTVGNKFASMFRWRDPATTEEIVVMYHRSYGSNFELSGGGGLFPNTTVISESSGSALASYFRSDNTGPPATVSEVESIFETVRVQFPNADVFGSTMDAFAAEVTSADITMMPLLENEWGDQWLGGMQTDPWRIQVYREMLRLREECIEQGTCVRSSTAMLNMTRWLAKISEHTQGVQNEGWSPGVPGCTDAQGNFLSPCTTVTNAHWSNARFAEIHNDRTNVFTGADLSWIEARKFNALAIGALEAQAGSDKGAASLASAIKAALPTLRPRQSSTVGLTKLASLGEVIKCGGLELGFDSKNGAIAHLSFGSGSPQQPWATANATLLDLRYMTYNDRANLTCNESGCPNPIPGSWKPTLATVHHNCSGPAGSCTSCRVVTETAWNATLSGKYGSASRVVTEYTLTPGDSKLSVQLKLFNKTTTRLPEATVLLFQPHRVAGTAAARHDYGWAMDVLGGWVDPYDVLSGGQQWAHAIWSGVKYAAKRGSSATGLFIDSLDAAMACPMIAQWHSQCGPGDDSCSGCQSGTPNADGCSLRDDGAERICDAWYLNGPGGQQQLNRTAGW